MCARGKARETREVLGRGGGSLQRVAGDGKARWSRMAEGPVVLRKPGNAGGGAGQWAGGGAGPGSESTQEVVRAGDWATYQLRSAFRGYRRRYMRRRRRRRRQNPSTLCALYDKLYRPDVLAHVYARCRANKGAPGVDGQTFDDIERYGRERLAGGAGASTQRRSVSTGANQARLHSESQWQVAAAASSTARFSGWSRVGSNAPSRKSTPARRLQRDSPFVLHKN